VMLDGSTLGRCLVAGGLRSGHGSRAMMVHGDVSYLIFLPKPSTHHMNDPGSMVQHIWPKSVHK
jgi:hypothetical protein